MRSVLRSARAASSATVRAAWAGIFSVPRSGGLALVAFVFGCTHSPRGIQPAKAAAPENGTSALPPAPAAVDVGSSGRVPPLIPWHWAGYRAALTYTFDDSRPSQMQHWAELESTGIHATYFLTTGSRRNQAYEATWRAVLRSGNELGNHTVHHCRFDLTGCFGGSLPTVQSEIDECTEYEMESLGAPAVWTMAYPYGDRAYAVEARSRFVLARGVQNGFVAPGDSTDPWDLPVAGVAGGETAAALNRVIDHARAEGQWIILVFHTLRPQRPEEEPYAGVEIADVIQSIGYAKARGDVWVDTLVAIGAYWLGEKYLLSATPTWAEGKATWKWTLPAHFPPNRALRVTVNGGVLSQRGVALQRDPRGYYEVELDAGGLSWQP